MRVLIRGTQRGFIHTGEKQGGDGAERDPKILVLKVGVTWPQAKECWKPPDT